MCVFVWIDRVLLKITVLMFTSFLHVLKHCRHLILSTLKLTSIWPVLLKNYPCSLRAVRLWILFWFVVSASFTSSLNWPNMCVFTFLAVFTSLSISSYGMPYFLDKCCELSVVKLHFLFHHFRFFKPPMSSMWDQIISQHHILLSECGKTLVADEVKWGISEIFSSIV